MKFEKMSIECKSQEDKLNVANALDKLGYSSFGDCINYDHLLFVHTYNHGSYQDYGSNDDHDGAELITSSQFQSKYSNQFHEKIKQAMSDFGLGREELSRKLGYSDPYITKMLTLPQSEKVKKKVSEKIDNLYQPKKSIGTLVVDLEQSPEFKKAIAETKAEIKKVAEENEQLKKELEESREKARSAKAHSEEVVKYSLDLEKELDHKNQVLDKRNDLFKDAEYEIASLNKTIESLQTVLNEKNEDIEGIKAAFGRVTKVGSNRIAELENLNKKLGIDLSKRNKDVNLLNFGCVVLGLIILIMACFLAGG